MLFRTSSKLGLAFVIACFALFGSHAGTIVQIEETGVGLICDTDSQVRDVISLTAKGADLDESIEQVNEGTSACGVAAVAFVRGETTGQIETPAGLVNIVRITVVGVVLSHGIEPIAPLEQFTAFLADECDPPPLPGASAVDHERLL